ncbi:MAG: 2-oxoglutarate dehydrogenase, subunit, dihydrolipoamide succinyltransferase [Chthonomonadales bacterium]|nr:2-oxoglutarate dehydrogenase, subunit, dihydrolipoamide succinyltransferase [Chthonomonadales bacterium]
MSEEIRVPSMGESILEATLVRWLKKEGEAFAIGDELVELETDKANSALEAEYPGVLEKIVRKEGDTVAVGEVLALALPSSGSAPSASNGTAPKTEPTAAPPVEPVADNGRPAPHTTPLADKIAKDKGVDLSQITGTGAGGKVTREDVEKATQVAAPVPVTTPKVETTTTPSIPIPPPATRTPVAVPAASDREERIPMSRTRQVIAARLKEAQNTAAMLTTFNEVDMTAIMDLRKRRNEAFEKRNGIKIGFMSFFTKAVVGALKAFPYLNAEIQGTDIVVKKYYDIGIAVGAPEGLIVPVLRDADKKSFAQIEKDIKDLAERARAKKIALPELMGGSFTITNGGIFGSLMSTPILNAPQVGILGMHKIQERPMVVEGQIVIRPMMYLALSYDHRIVDGSEAVRFLVRVKELLEDPESLLLEG